MRDPTWPLHRPLWQYQPPVTELTKDPSPPIPLEGTATVTGSFGQGQFAPGQPMQFVTDGVPAFSV